MRLQRWLHGTLTVSFLVFTLLLCNCKLAKSLNKPWKETIVRTEDLIPWDCHIKWVLDRLYSLILCEKHCIKRWILSHLIPVLGAGTVRFRFSWQEAQRTINSSLVENHPCRDISKISLICNFVCLFVSIHVKTAELIRLTFFVVTQRF